MEAQGQGEEVFIQKLFKLCVKVKGWAKVQTSSFFCVCVYNQTVSIILIFVFQAHLAQSSHAEETEQLGGSAVGEYAFTFDGSAKGTICRNVCFTTLIFYTCYGIHHVFVTFWELPRPIWGSVTICPATPGALTVWCYVSEI